MNTTIKRFSTLSLFLFLVFADTTFAAPPGGGALSFGGEFRNLILVKGRVLCTECDLDSIRKQHNRVELKHVAGTLVFEVHEVSEPLLWNDLIYRRTFVRATHTVFQKLLDAKNTEVELTVLLRSTGTLDLFEVTTHQ